MYDGSLYCFCLLAESYETINQSVNQIYNYACAQTTYICAVSYCLLFGILS